jgi:hypothetical protein
LTDRVTWYFGTPTVFVAIPDARALGFKGQPLAVTIITQGVPRSAPSGLQVLSDAQVRTDLERPLASGTQSIAFINALLCLMAAVLAAGIARLLAPGFPFTVEIPLSAFPRLLFVAVAVGLAASVAGLRRAVGVQPALALGGP